MAGVLMMAAAVAGGWGVVRASGVCGGWRPRWAAWMVEAGLGAALGLGAQSAVFFVLLWAGLGAGAAAWVGYGVVGLGGAGLWWWRRGPVVEGEMAVEWKWTWVAGVAFGVALLMFAAGFAATSGAQARGEWDAWAIWNLRAKFLAGEGTWRHAVSVELTRTHPEYPLGWPGVVGGAWAAGGETGTAVPVVAAAVVGVGAAVVVAGTVGVMEGGALGLLAGMILLVSGAWWRQAASQYADVPLSLYIVGALAAAALAERRGWAAGGMVVSGALASMAAWTKNEGMLFLAVCGLTVLLVARGRAVAWVLGALPVGLLVAAFKLTLAPGVRSFDLAKLGEVGRVGTVAAGFAKYAWGLGEFPAQPLVLVGLLGLALGMRRVGWVLVPVGLLLLGDFVMVWGTTNELGWQIDTAVERLWVQVLPGVLVGVGVKRAGGMRG